MTDLQARDVRDLRQTFAGTVVTEGEPGYDEARSIWNGAITKKPSVIACCASPSDVAAALAFAQSEALAVSVPGGGHNSSPSALTAGAPTIDLTTVRPVTIGADARPGASG